jgi:hypothetical protein
MLLDNDGVEDSAAPLAAASSLSGSSAADYSSGDFGSSASAAPPTASAAVLTPLPHGQLVLLGAASSVLSDVCTLAAESTLTLGAGLPPITGGGGAGAGAGAGVRGQLASFPSASHGAAQARLSPADGTRVVKLLTIADGAYTLGLSASLFSASAASPAPAAPARGAASAALTEAERGAIEKAMQLRWPNLTPHSLRATLLRAITGLFAARRVAFAAIRTILSLSPREVKAAADCRVCRGGGELERTRRGAPCVVCSRAQDLQQYLSCLVGSKTTREQEDMSAFRQDPTKAGQSGHKRKAGSGSDGLAAAGNLGSLLNAENAGSGDESEEAAGGAADGAAATSANFAVPTALARVLKALAAWPAAVADGSSRSRTRNRARSQARRSRGGAGGRSDASDSESLAGGGSDGSSTGGDDDAGTGDEIDGSSDGSGGDGSHAPLVNLSELVQVALLQESKSRGAAWLAFAVESDRRRAGEDGGSSAVSGAAAGAAGSSRLGLPASSAVAGDATSAGSGQAASKRAKSAGNVAVGRGTGLRSGEEHSALTPAELWELQALVLPQSRGSGSGATGAGVAASSSSATALPLEPNPPARPAPRCLSPHALLSALVTSLEKEARQLFVIRDAQLELLKTRDEVESATTRMQVVCDPVEASRIAPEEANYRVPLYEAAGQMEEQRDAIAAASAQLHLKLVPQMRYLLSLRAPRRGRNSTGDDGSGGGSSVVNPASDATAINAAGAPAGNAAADGTEPAPAQVCCICQDVLGTGSHGRVAMFKTCGHAVCASHLTQMQRLGLNKCPECRQTLSYDPDAENGVVVVTTHIAAAATAAGVASANVSAVGSAVAVSTGGGDATASSGGDTVATLADGPSAVPVSTLQPMANNVPGLAAASAAAVGGDANAPLPAYGRRGGSVGRGAVDWRKALLADDGTDIALQLQAGSAGAGVGRARVVDDAARAAAGETFGSGSDSGAAEAARRMHGLQPLRGGAPDSLLASGPTAHPRPPSEHGSAVDDWGLLAARVLRPAGSAAAGAVSSAAAGAAAPDSAGAFAGDVLLEIDAAAAAVEGDWGAKVQVLVRCIKTLLLQDARARSYEAAQATVASDDADGGGSTAAVSAETALLPLQPQAGRMPQHAQQRLRRLSATKAIVFSEWDAALEIAEAALQANGIACVRLRNDKDAAKKLPLFKGQAPSASRGKVVGLGNGGFGASRLGGRDAAKSSAIPTFDAPSSASTTRAALTTEAAPTCGADIPVLLLSYARGAEGLNVTEASHVFLLEPALDPATEAQAVGRIYRMGQKRRTFIHRFVARGTIEEAVVAVNRSRRLQQALHHHPSNDGAGVAAGPLLTAAAADTFTPSSPAGTSATGSLPSAVSLPAGHSVALRASSWVNMLVKAQMHEFGLRVTDATLAGRLSLAEGDTEGAAAAAAAQAAQHQHGHQQHHGGRHHNDAALTRVEVLRLLHRFMDA